MTVVVAESGCNLLILSSHLLTGERVKASPYAKKLAREAGVDVSQASPTGPEGRIVAADVQKLIESGGGKAAPKAEKAAPSKEEAPSTPQRAEVIARSIFANTAHRGPMSYN